MNYSCVNVSGTTNTHGPLLVVPYMIVTVISSASKPVPEKVISAPPVDVIGVLTVLI